MTEVRALVVGGGIAGLTAAIALRQRGVAVDVVERDPTWSVYGVGIIQQANVVRAVAALGVLDDYLASSFGFNHIEMFAPDGSPVARIPSPRLTEGDYPANLGVSRPALHKVFGERAKAEGAAIFLGVTVESLEDKGEAVQVAFSDGRSQSYSFVVGADGLYSQVRDMILPDAPKPAYTGQAVWRYNFPRSPDVQALQVYNGRVGAGLVPLSDSLMYLFLTSAEPGNPRLPREGLAAAMRERMATAGAPQIRALAEQVVDDEAVVYRPLETLFIDGGWSRGRVVMIGDAVHATTPHLGQGAGMAIEDSLVLAEEMSATPSAPEEAFQRFEARRAPRCRFIVESSAAVGEFQLGRRAALDYPGLTREMFQRTAAPL